MVIVKFFVMTQLPLPLITSTQCVVVEFLMNKRGVPCASFVKFGFISENGRWKQKKIRFVISTNLKWHRNSMWRLKLKNVPFSTNFR